MTFVIIINISCSSLPSSGFGSNKRFDIIQPFLHIAMPSSIFEIREHTVECQHIREYARATANSQEEVLQLSVKQYIPLDNPNPEVGDLTIIGAHANGFAKVKYSYIYL